MCKILLSSKQNAKLKITPTVHVTDLNWIISKTDVKNLIQILCCDLSGVCKCMEIFLPDDEARQNFQAVPNTNTPKWFASTCWSFIHIWSYQSVSDCEHDYWIMSYFSHTWYNTITLPLLLYSLTYFKNLLNKWNKILLFLSELQRLLFLWEGTVNYWKEKAHTQSYHFLFIEIR